MARWFQSQNRFVQILLLLIPIVNWVIEIGVRWSAFLSNKRFFTLLFAILVTFFGLVFGWIDMLWCLLFKHMIFAKA